MPEPDWEQCHYYLERILNGNSMLAAKLLHGIDADVDLIELEEELAVVWERLYRLRDLEK